MVEKHGKKKATALERYVGVTSLSQIEAKDLLKTLWPKAPPVEVLKAAIICHQYGLNPLMKQLFLIPFKKKGGGEDWAAILGISANRAIARRRHNYAYLDLSPRMMTEEEQVRINGSVDSSRVWAITILRDVDTGAEATGVSFWPKGERPHGEDKGNTQLHMAGIRSERNALAKLYPVEMPQGIEVMDERYIEGEFKELPSKTEVAETTVPEAEEKKEETGKEETKGRGEAGAGVSATEDKSKKIAGAPPAKPSRDPNSLKTINDLLKACNEDFKMQPKEVYAELNVSSQSEIADTPADCYRVISSVRNP